MADAKIKVSELSVILDKNIDDKDLFLVSDRNNNQFFSRQMTMSQLRQYVSKKTLASSEFKAEVKNIAKTSHLFDTRENWEKDPLKHLVLAKGQIAFVNDAAVNKYYMKVGNGTSKFYALPYIDCPTGGGSSIVINTKAGWAAQPKFKPAIGQIVIWSDKAQIPKYEIQGDELVQTGTIDVPGIKIGDGGAFNLDLPYVGDDIEQKIQQLTQKIQQLDQTVQQHLADADMHVSETDRKSWMHKITIGKLDTPSDDGVEGETLIIKRD